MSTCLIWGTKADSASDSGDFARVNSPRVDGKYRVTGTAIPAVGRLDTTQKKLLTTWVLQQRRLGVETPEISSRTLDDIKTQSLQSFAARIDEVFRYFSKHLTKIGAQFRVADGDSQSAWERLAAHTECEDCPELLALLHVMVDQDLLKVDSSHIHFRIAPAGYERMDALERQRTDSAQAFIAMWFNAATAAAYADGIKAAVEKAGYKAMRIDGKEHINKIDDEIIAEIRRSRFVVSDFTCEPEKPRGGVYFEAGFAMGLGIPVIWTAAESSINDLHFDTRQYNHIAWSTPDELRDKLYARIGAVIGDGPLKK
jgi:hypothetical protein